LKHNLLTNRHFVVKHFQ